MSRLFFIPGKDTLVTIPDGWSYDPDYGGSPAWWHEDCPTPSMVGGDYDEIELGGVAIEERVDGHLVGIICLDCEEVIPMRKRPT